MKSLTSGNPAKLMISFALPVCLGNIFQLFYSLADTRIVGSTLGEGSLAAVGATTAVSTLLIGFLQGMANGFSIISAQSMGAKEEKQLRQTAAGTLVLGGVITLFLTVLSLTLLPLLLHVLNVPDDLYPEAHSYISIILLGLIVTMLYNACAGILRAVGDTIAPLVFLVCASLLNVRLDFLLIAGIHLGVRGAALGTVISQSVSVLLCFLYIWKKYPLFHLKKEDFCLTKDLVQKMLSSGLSMGMMMSLVYFGTLALQTSINTFGTDTIVAHTAARKIIELYFLPIVVMGTTLSTFCSQNYGAGKMDRVYQGMKYALMINWSWTLIVIFMSYTIAPQLIYLVSGSSKETVLAPAVLYLKVNAPFFFLSAAINLLRNTLQAIGDHWTPIISSTIELVGKVLIVFFLVPVLQYMGIIVTEPIIWILMIIPLLLRFIHHPESAVKHKKEITG